MSLPVILSGLGLVKAYEIAETTEEKKSSWLTWSLTAVAIFGTLYLLDSRGVINVRDRVTPLKDFVMKKLGEKDVLTTLNTYIPQRFKEMNFEAAKMATWQKIGVWKDYVVSLISKK